MNTQEICEICQFLTTSQMPLIRWIQFQFSSTHACNYPTLMRYILWKFLLSTLKLFWYFRSILVQFRSILSPFRSIISPFLVRFRSISRQLKIWALLEPIFELFHFFKSPENCPKNEPKWCKTHCTMLALELVWKCWFFLLTNIHVFAETPCYIAHKSQWIIRKICVIFCSLFC